MSYIAARVNCMSFVELIISGTYTTLTDTTTPTLTSTVTAARTKGLLRSSLPSTWALWPQWCKGEPQYKPRLRR